MATDSKIWATGTPDNIWAKMIDNGDGTFSPCYYDLGPASGVKYAPVAASSGNNTIVGAVASKKIRVLCVNLYCGTSLTVQFQSGTGGTALTGVISVIAAAFGVLAGAQGAVQWTYSPVGHFETAVSTLLNLNVSGNVNGNLVYQEV